MAKRYLGKSAEAFLLWNGAAFDEHLWKRTQNPEEIGQGESVTARMRTVLTTAPLASRGLAVDGAGALWQAVQVGVTATGTIEGLHACVMERVRDSAKVTAVFGDAPLLAEDGRCLLDEADCQLFREETGDRIVAARPAGQQISQGDVIMADPEDGRADRGRSHTVSAVAIANTRLSGAVAYALNTTVA